MRDRVQEGAAERVGFLEREPTDRRCSDIATPTTGEPIPVSFIGLNGVGGLRHVAQPELADILDQFEESMLELLSLACAPTTPRPQSKWMRGDDVDSSTLRAAPAGNVPPVGQKPHLV
jgi:hypothetical protein